MKLAEGQKKKERKEKQSQITAFVKRDINTNKLGYLKNSPTTSPHTVCHRNNYEFNTKLLIFV